MSKGPSVNVDVITEVKGLQNLTRARNEMGLLGNSAKKLAGSLASAFAVGKLAQFGKTSVKAFADNQKQIALLTATLNNLGQGFKALSVNAFIDHLQLASGVSRDELIPAFQALFIATGDVTKAQDALQLAMDISAGTGKDLASVQAALSKGYLGNTTALARLGAGLDKSLLKTGDMTKITKQLALLFKGDAAIAADTIAGKMSRLSVAVKEVEVTIGGGLVDALMMLGGNTSIETLQSQMDAFAQSTSNAIRGVGALIAKLKNNSIGNAILGTIGDVISAGPLGALSRLGANTPEGKAAMRSRQQYGGAAADRYNAEKAATTARSLSKIEQEKLKTNLAQKKAVADKIALENASMALKLASFTTDMANIQIQAALQKKQTAEVNNVLLLQRDLITGNADQANVLTKEVLKANDLVMDVNGNIGALGTAKDPFKDWPAASSAAAAELKKIQSELAMIQSKTIAVNVNTVYTSSGSSSAVESLRAAEAASASGLTVSGDASKTASEANAAAAAAAAAVAAAAAAATAAATKDKDAALEKLKIAEDAAKAAQEVAANTAKDNASLMESMRVAAAAAAAAAAQAAKDNAAALERLKAAEDAAAAAVAAASGSSGSTATGAYDKNPIVITVVASPTLTVEHTQDASTNGTAVTVNRINPFGLYSTV
jgi:hypothetical protein